MPTNEETISIIPLIEVADHIEGQVEEDLRQQHIEAYELNCLHLEAVGRLAHLYTNEFIHHPIEGLTINQETAHLVEIAGYLHDGAKMEQDFIMHHLTSATYSEKVMDSAPLAGFLSTEQKQVIVNAVKRHQGMPYMDNIALATLRETVKTIEQEGSQTEGDTAIVTRWEKLIEKDPLIPILGKFPPPNDEASALLYCADLLSLGQTHSEGKDPRAGAFDKIVQIELNAKKPLLEAIKSAQSSLKANVTRLREAQPYTEEEKEKMRTLGFGDEEFQGRERAAIIERALGEKYGDEALQRIGTLVNLAENPPKDIPMENTMECYYALARRNAKALEETFEV